jgi:hydroxypyruvate isomerase
MINPWHKRANELIRDPLALLPLISPQPIRQFFSGDASSLFDRLVIVVGSPGSGKTTLARLLEFNTLVAALDSHDRSPVKPLLEALTTAGVVKDLRPKFLAVRLPANAQYRAIWELPYSEAVRHKLLRSLLQARAVLGWLRQLEQERVDLSTVRIETADIGEAQRLAIHADSPSAMRQLARETESEIFKVLSALVPPSEAQLGAHLSAVTYDPLSSLLSFVIPDFRGDTQALELRPLLIVDDAHELHLSQFADLDLWLRNREVRVARWVLTRVDSINPSEFRRALVTQEIERPLPGTTPGRDRILRMLQGRDKKANFRPVAADISRRYLAQLGSFAVKNITNLTDVLATAQPKLSATDLKRLRSQVAALAKDNALSPEAEQALQEYLPPQTPEDLKLGVSRILLHREALRTPQRSLFAGLTKEGMDEEATSPKRVDKAVVTGAEIQLLHEFDRAFFYGFDRLADASNSNIEQFISLASVLVDEVETLIVRGKTARLDAKRQHEALTERAGKIMREWDFPYAPHVRRVVDYITRQCTQITLQGNAPLDDGANAFGVPQDDLKQLDSDSDFARVVHYALAYQAIVLVEEYSCKGKQWCLFELGGVPCIAGRLTLGRGGFAEGRLAHLQQVVVQ